MKKNLSRALSLLLVLVLLLGAMPMALASENTTPDDELGDDEQIDAYVSISASPANPKVGEPVTFTAIIPLGYTPVGTGFSWTGATAVGTNGATATYSAAGTYTVAVTALLKGADNIPTTVSDTYTVVVSEDEDAVTDIAITGAPSAVYVGDTFDLNCVTVPAGGQMVGDPVWSSSNNAVATVNDDGLVTAKAAGNVNISVTWDGKVDVLVLQVEEAGYAQLVVTPGSLTLAPKEVGGISGNVKYGSRNLSYGTDYTITMKSNNTRVAQVDASNGRVTAIGAGETKIIVTATLTTSAAKTIKFAGNSKTQSVEIPVEVEDQYYIVCANESARAGSRITLTPYLYDGTGARVTSATFSFSATGNVSVTSTGDKTFTASSNTPGTATVTFTAKGYNNDGAAITKVVNLGFYRSGELTVSTRDNISSFRFYDRNVLQSARSSGQNYTNLNTTTVAELISMAMPITGTYNLIDYYSFSASGSNGGDLLSPTSGSSLNWTSGTKYVDSSNLDAVGFQQRSSTNKVSNFTVYAMAGGTTDGVIVGALTLQINAGAASAGIEYSTTYKTPVTFKVTDFQNYWNSHKNGNYNNSYNSNSTYNCGCNGLRTCYEPSCRFYVGTTTNNGYYTNETLSYVTFGISNTVPAYGTLYTTSAKSVKATAGMKFYATNYNTNSSTYSYALSGVTYVPATNYTASYSVDIPFTAYGTNGTSITGYVTVKLNEQGNTIGARGTTLDSSVAESIAANYYNAKGQTMGYVIFDLPSAQQATLYRSIPKVNGYSRVTEAARVQTGDRFYYYSTSNYYSTTGSYNCGCNNAYYCNNVNCIYYDGNSYTTGTINCGCNNLKYCTNSYCKFYDGPAYNCGCNNAYYCSNSYCVYYDGATNNNYNTTTNTNNQYSANQMKLTDVSIVPAAGFKGKLTLTYTAYNAGGASPYTGYITYDVETLTASKVFSDVKSSYSWAADSADFLYYEGTAQGSNGKYNPSANITRGDFMLMLYRAFLEEEYGSKTVTSNFSDVTKGTSTYSQETYQAVGIAKELGIAQGTNGKFNPKANITREEAMVLIYRTLDEINRTLRYSSSTKASSFGDYSKISSWATSAISDLVSHGVIQGNNNKVNPKSNITRAEMACILHRVITY